jgi:hypothetical protein
VVLTGDCCIAVRSGGGYIYRLCPRGSTLSEECFQRAPLQFVGRSSLRWNGIGGEQHFFDPTTVTVQSPALRYRGAGEVPGNSSWRMNPIPRNDTFQTGESFAPVCDEVAGCNAHQRTDETQTKQDMTCRCSGIWGPYNVEIMDTVAVPEVPPGDYVVGFRYDCVSRPLTPPPAPA